MKYGSYKSDFELELFGDNTISLIYLNNKRHELQKKISYIKFAKIYTNINLNNKDLIFNIFIQFYNMTNNDVIFIYVYMYICY